MFCPVHYDIVKIPMEFPNSNHLQLTVWLLPLIIYIFFHITNRGNSYGILIFWLHRPITFSHVLNYIVYTLGSRCWFSSFTLIFFFPAKNSWKSSRNFKIQIICNLVLLFSWVSCSNYWYFGSTLQYVELWDVVVAYFSWPSYVVFGTKKSWKFSWNSNIQIICFGSTLEYFKFNWKLAVVHFLWPSYFVLSTRISWKFSWNVKIHIICNFLFFILDCTYMPLLFWFHVKPFQIMENRCSLFFVTFTFCP